MEIFYTWYEQKLFLTDITLMTTEAVRTEKSIFLSEVSFTESLYTHLSQLLLQL